jgi:hypothetical protein
VARRFTGLLAASMLSAVLLLVTACANGGSPSSTPTTSSPAQSATASQSATPSVQQLVPLFLQCLAQHNIPIWDKSQGNVSVISLGKKEGWYQDGKVVANNALHTYFEDFEGFYPIGTDFKPEQTIGAWVDNAASTGTWPKVCGPLPAAS